MLVRKKLVNLLSLLIIMCAGSAHAFDLGNYATTYRATRDLYLKAGNEQRLAEGPWAASARAMIDLQIGEQLRNDNAEAVELLVKMKSKIAQCGM